MFDTWLDAPSTQFETNDVFADMDKLLDCAATHSDHSETTCRPHPDVIALLINSGIPGTFVQSRWAEGAFSAVTAAVLAISTACPTTGWLASVYAYSARIIDFLDEEVSTSLAGDPSSPALIAAALPPQGRAVRDGDDWVLSGAWTYVTGTRDADWVVLAAMTDHAPRYFVVDRAAVSIVGEWNPLGMRGTDTTGVVADSVRVSHDRTVSIPDVMAGRAAGDRRLTPMSITAGLTFLGPLIGTTHAIAKQYLRTLKEPDDIAAIKVGRTLASLSRDTRELHRIANGLDDGALTMGAGGAISLLAHSSRLSLNDIAGQVSTGSFAGPSTTQKLMRDALTIASHKYFLNSDRGFGPYGLSALETTHTREG